jgi:hypothetical protein
MAIPLRLALPYIPVQYSSLIILNQIWNKHINNKTEYIGLVRGLLYIRTLSDTGTTYSQHETSDIYALPHTNFQVVMYLCFFLALFTYHAC